MTTPDLLSTVGFSKSKIGSGDKEVGYQINESSLCSLFGGALVCFAVMGFLVVFMVYDIHFEKKTIHQKARVEEHHAASKLAQVQMELWSQYRDDISESKEAGALLKSLDSSYDEFKGKFQGAITEFAHELSINEVKAGKFADKILHLVADMQEHNVKHAKHLLDHLVSSGQRSKQLKKHVTKDLRKDVMEEKKHLEEDKLEGIEVVHPTTSQPQHVLAGAEVKAALNESNLEAEDPLKVMLEGFWFTFNDYEREFKGTVRKSMHDGSPVYEQIKVLYGKIRGENPIGEEEVQEELDKIDLSSVGAGLGSGRVLPVTDIVEEIALIPKIPHKELVKLEKQWRAGELDSVLVFEQLNEWHHENIIPSGWLQGGVNQAEKEDEAEEEAEDEEANN